MSAAESGRVYVDFEVNDPDFVTLGEYGYVDVKVNADGYVNNADYKDNFIAGPSLSREVYGNLAYVGNLEYVENDTTLSGVTTSLDVYVKRGSAVVKVGTSSILFCHTGASTTGCILNAGKGYQRIFCKNTFVTDKFFPLLLFDAGVIFSFCGIPVFNFSFYHIPYTKMII